MALHKNPIRLDYVVLTVDVELLDWSFNVDNSLRWMAMLTVDNLKAGNRAPGPVGRQVVPFDLQRRRTSRRQTDVRSNRRNCRNRTKDAVDGSM